MENSKVATQERQGGATWFDETPEGVIVSVKAVPRSSKPGLDGLYGTEALKVRIKAAPVEGKANKELAEVLARAFGIPKSAVEIKSGTTSKHKRILLRGVDARAFVAATSENLVL